jgi:transposase
MSPNPIPFDTQGQSVLYMALELSQKTWKLGFSQGLAQKPRLRNIGARDTSALRQEIEAAKKRFGLPKDTPVVSCYEAGRDGFWLHRFLVSVQVENLVVDSSSILVSRRKRRAKTDRLDAEKLLNMLIRWRQGEAGVWSVVKVPGIEDENARHLHRELKTLRNEQTAHTNRIKGLLAAYGVTAEVNRHLPERLKELRLWDGTPLPADLHQRLLREFERMQTANRQIRQLEEERARRIREDDQDPGVALVRQLLALKAIGVNSAWLYVREIFGWRQIRNRRELGALVGMVPTPYKSGGDDHEQGISKAGNRRVRAMGIEIAWCWLEFQPQSELSVWYQRRFGHGNRRQRKIGIVALGRKLLVALLKYLTTGVPPEGAELADWREKFHYTAKLT